MREEMGMSKKGECNRLPGHSRCLKLIEKEGCPSEQCAETVSKYSQNGSSIKPVSGESNAGRYCTQCFHEAVSSEKSCMSCHSRDIVDRPGLPAEEIIVPSVHLCTKHPKLNEIVTYCPLNNSMNQEACR